MKKEKKQVEILQNKFTLYFELWCNTKTKDPFFKFLAKRLVKDGIGTKNRFEIETKKYRSHKHYDSDINTIQPIDYDKESHAK